MRKHDYNAVLIENLNINSFIKLYNFTNKKYNDAIFYALSSLYEHSKEKKLKTNSILLGDYYSFEYYSILKNDLIELKRLASVMQKGYLEVSNTSVDFRSFSLEIIRLWFDFYGKELKKSDIELIGYIDIYGEK